MEKSIWSYQTYKDYLRAQCEITRGSKTKIAQACGCEKSYLSKVLSQEVHLTPDHGFKLCDFLSLTDNERDFFMTLLELDRAGAPTYKKFLQKKIDSLRKIHELNQRKNNRTEISENNNELLYNSSWIYCAVNILTSIPQYQTLAKISERLQLPPQITLKVLTSLESMGFVKKQNQRWLYQAGAAHISPNSPLVYFHHSNWRQQAMLDAQNPSSDGLHYTNIQSISETVLLEIRTKIHKLLKDVGDLAEPSPCEELVCLNLDFFRV